MKNFLETSIKRVLEYIVVYEAYPPMTQKHSFIGSALSVTATSKLIKARLQQDRGFVSKIANVVRLFCSNCFGE